MARRPRSGSRPPRRRPALPTYTHSQAPNAELTWVDRLRVKFPGSHIVYRDRDQLRSYLREVTQGEVFRFTDQRWPVKLGTRPGWPFGAEVTIRPSRARPDEWAHLDLKLDLNPTRFAVHNDRPLEEVRAGPARNMLRGNEGLKQEALSLSLDGQDNIIPTRRLGQVRTRYFHRLMPIYLQKVRELIEGTFTGSSTSAAPDQPPPIRSVFEPGDRPRAVFQWGGWVLQQCEHYWEFREASAPLLVMSLRGGVEQISRHLRQHDYDVTRVSSGADVNSLSLTVQLGAQGVWLGIYAKAEDRLRVEVRLYRNPRRTYGAQSIREEYPNDHLEELVPFIEFIGRQAHERAEVFFGALRDQVGAVPASVTRLSELLGGVSRACDGDESAIRRVLSQLVASGRIAQTPDPEMRARLDALERAGVLSRTRSTRRTTPVVYAISSRYAETLRALRDLVEREVQEQS